MKYRRNSAVSPNEASRFVFPRCLRVLMMTLYVASRVEKALLKPIIVGICPAAILMAEPVMKAEIAGREMTSTIQPSRAKPKKSTMEPAMIANEEAITSRDASTPVASALSTTLPVTVDKTATGPIVISLEVAKNQ